MAETVKQKKATVKPRNTATRKETVTEIPKPAKAAKAAKTTTPKASKIDKLVTAVAKPRQTAVKKVRLDAAAMTVKQAAPSHEQIEQLARTYWAGRGYEDGQAEQDWLRAEQELLHKRS